MKPRISLAIGAVFVSGLAADGARAATLELGPAVAAVSGEMLRGQAVTVEVPVASLPRVSIGLELDREATVPGPGAFPGDPSVRTGIADMLISVPDTGPAQLDVVAEATVARSGNTSLSGINTARAAAALVFQVGVTQDAESLFSAFMVDRVPLTATILAFFEATTTGIGEGSDRSVASVRGEVVASYQPIGIDAEARLDFDGSRSVSEALSISASSEGSGFAEFDPGPTSFAFEIDIDRPLNFGKAVEARALANTDGVPSTTSQARGLLDPLISFDQAAFQSLYGARCRAELGLETCPDMDALFDLAVSADISNVPAPIPLPAAGWMLLAGLVGMAVAARRRG